MLDERRVGLELKMMFRIEIKVFLLGVKEVVLG